MTITTEKDKTHTFPDQVEKTFGRSESHGMTDSREWKTWKSMLDRCYLKSHKSHKDYGGRGILVCSRWHRFSNFYSDMGDRPALMTIGRIENDKGYFPGNCQWETSKENANNRRSSAFVSFNGETKTIAQWSDSTGIAVATIANRIKLGWDVGMALTTELRPQKNSLRTSRRSVLVPSHLRIVRMLFANGSVGANEFGDTDPVSVTKIIYKLRKRGFVIGTEGDVGRDPATGRVNPSYKFHLLAYPAGIVSSRELGGGA